MTDKFDRPPTGLLSQFDHDRPSRQPAKPEQDPHDQEAREITRHLFSHRED